MIRGSNPFVALCVILSFTSGAALNIRSSVFLGKPITFNSDSSQIRHHRCGSISSLVMRKQKASDKRTRRRQRGDDVAVILPETATISAMQESGEWRQKTVQASVAAPTGGRGRSRKRSTFYQSVSFYHNKFLNLLTQEYQAEELEVLGRIKASLDDPIGLECAGHALLDLYPTRRGNLFSDEVYRLNKAADASTFYSRDDDDENSSLRCFPPNHKFSVNDVIVLTLQPNGSGDFFCPQSLPTSDAATKVEARVLGVGQTYLDIALSAGSFEGAFGPAPNDMSGLGDKQMRLRADRFFSNVPYERMMSALVQLTNIQDRSKDSSKENSISMDETLRELIISTHAFSDSSSPLLHEKGVCDLQEMSNRLSKPPMPNSQTLAHQVLKYMRSNPQEIFPKFNTPQLTAIEAALTRRMTMIQGPPGTGKTTTAAAIAFGFVHQCRTLSPHAKVLGCAFSNVGADNLAEALVRLGLKVVRVGKPSAVMESLWDITLDAAIDRDPDAQKALKVAAKATAQLSSLGRSRKKSPSPTEKAIREAATAAVKKSIKVCKIAATKALREADIVISTSSGAADPRLLAACGIVTKDEDDEEGSKTPRIGRVSVEPDMRVDAPDGGPPLSLPFVLVDEACQSVEPASLIPIVSSNSCRSLVLLGDPCQLPPTVKADHRSLLSVSLMERLSAALPRPDVPIRVDSTKQDNSYLEALPIRQARSLLHSRNNLRQDPSYKKRFAGSLLLSVQYRMHPSISALPSAIFYDGLLSTPESITSQRSFPDVLRKAMPCADPKTCVRLIDVGGRQNEQRNTLSQPIYGAGRQAEATSYSNEMEAERVLTLLKDILRDNDSDVKSIGVITPYAAQVQLIKEFMARDRELKELLTGKLSATIEVKSVDGYQGRERDVIIFSAVRSNRRGNIGFLADWRRMNVALTRAKAGLLVIGDMETLREGDKHWDAFAKWASSVRCVVDDYDCLEDEPSL